MTSAQDSTTHARRVMIWTVPRTLSTVFCKCLSMIPDMRMIFEPYVAAAIFGPERRPLDPDSIFDEQYLHYYSEERILREAPKLPAEETNWFSADVCTYGWIKKQLMSAASSNAKVVICNDIASMVTGHYNSIPDGYIHVILIRNPYKNIPSHKRMCTTHMGFTDKDAINVNFRDMPYRLTGHKPTYGYKDLMDLYEHLKGNHGNQPITIIDADDLQNHTASILRQLLEDVIDIPYDDKYLQWHNSVEISKKWTMAKVFGYKSLIEEGLGVHAKGLTSTRFEPATEAPSRELLTDDLLEGIDAAMPIYEKFHHLRLKP